MVEDIFRRALAAFKADRKEEARTLLMDIVEQDAQHEQAWLYLSALVDSLEEQQICLENVLTINPGNTKARQGLDTLQQKLMGRQAANPEPDPWASFAETASTPPIGAEPDDTADDNLFGESAFAGFPTFGSSFEAPEDTPGTDDPFSWLADAPTVSTDSERLNQSASSVDWGRDDQPAAYGSGRHIDEPTEDDYDAWVDNLPLGADDAARFGDSSFMLDDEDIDDSFAPTARGAQSAEFWDSPQATSTPSADDSFATFGTQDTSSQRRVEPANDDLFASAGGFADDDPNAVYFDDSEDDEFAFTFDDEDEDGADMLQARLNAVTASPSSAPNSSAQAAPRPAPDQPGVDYYRLIPADIEPAEGGVSSRTLMLVGGIVLMLVLNVASFALLML